MSSRKEPTVTIFETDYEHLTKIQNEYYILYAKYDEQVRTIKEQETLIKDIFSFLNPNQREDFKTRNPVNNPMYGRTNDDVRAVILQDLYGNPIQAGESIVDDDDDDDELPELPTRLSLPVSNPMYSNQSPLRRSKKTLRIKPSLNQIITGQTYNNFDKTTGNLSVVNSTGKKVSSIPPVKPPRTKKNNTPPPVPPRRNVKNI